MQTGQVIKIHSDFYYIETDNSVIECKTREVLKKQDKKILVGDYVRYENGYITDILERRNYIPRPSVANIDQIIIVSAAKEPQIDFQQLDRYISFAHYYNLDTKLCFNKNDLSQNDDLIEKVFEIYEPLGYDIIFTSALEKMGLEDLEQIMKGKTSVFCGQSGVGKSSLINALNPKFNLKTKTVSEKNQRGTHTTRHCEIMKISDDIKIIDTPGFNNLKFDFLLPQDVGKLFKEFHPYLNKCKFQDCLHIQETGCKILENIDKFYISRYESYLEFIKEAKDYKERIKFQGKKTETRFKQTHNKIAVKIDTNKRQGSRKTLKQELYKELDDE